jgi:hypothetical protein
LKAVLIHADGKRGLLAGQPILPGRVDRQAVACIVDDHDKVVKQARPDYAVDFMSNRWFQRFEVDQEQIAMGEFQSWYADLNVSDDLCLTRIGPDFTSRRAVCGTQRVALGEVCIDDESLRSIVDDKRA